MPDPLDKLRFERGVLHDGFAVAADSMSSEWSVPEGACVIF